MARHGEVTLTLDRPPDAVFEAIVDVHSLPTVERAHRRVR